MLTNYFMMVRSSRKGRSFVISKKPKIPSTIINLRLFVQEDENYLIIFFNIYRKQRPMSQPPTRECFRPYDYTSYGVYEAIENVRREREGSYDGNLNQWLLHVQACGPKPRSSIEIINGRVGTTYRYHPCVQLGKPYISIYRLLTMNEPKLIINQIM